MVWRRTAVLRGPRPSESRRDVRGEEDTGTSRRSDFRDRPAPKGGPGKDELIGAGPGEDGRRGDIPGIFLTRSDFGEGSVSLPRGSLHTPHVPGRPPGPHPSPTQNSWNHPSSSVSTVSSASERFPPRCLSEEVRCEWPGSGREAWHDPAGDPAQQLFQPRRRFRAVVELDRDKAHFAMAPERFGAEFLATEQIGV